MNVRLAKLIGVIGVALALGGCAADASPPDTATPSASGTASSIDGIYRWSTTNEQAVGTPAQKEIGAEFPPDGFPAVPNTFTMTLDRGQWAWQGTATPAIDRGTYTVQGDIFEMKWAEPPIPWTLRMSFVADASGSLTMTPVAGFSEEPVNEFVFTHNPWTRIG